MSARRRRYRFVGRQDGYYYWISVSPIRGDSRFEEIRARVRWFWGQE